MKCCSLRLGPARRLTALCVSFAAMISSCSFAFVSVAKSVNEASRQATSSKDELQLISASATVTPAGILLRWHTNSTPDNLGFNVYRLQRGERARANRELIPGALFASGTPAMMRGGYSYAWFDRGGAADATYFIESVSVDGAVKIHEPIIPVTSKTRSEFEQTPQSLSNGDVNANANAFEKIYPAAELQQPNSPSGTIQEQWAIVGQAALKIAIKRDGWYRVTHAQMLAAGFNPTVDIRNLRLFVDANEVAISTSQSSGAFGSNDYIEFYGRGLDTPTTDTRIYYLIAGSTPGKRVIGEIKPDGDPVLPRPTATPTPPIVPGAPIVPEAPAVTGGPVLRGPVFFSWVQRDLSSWAASLQPNREPAAAAPKVTEKSRADNSEAVQSTGGNSNSAVGAVDENSQLANMPSSTAAEAGRKEQTAPAANANKQGAPPVLNSIAPGITPIETFTPAPKTFGRAGTATPRTPPPSRLARRTDKPAISTASRQLRKGRDPRKRKKSKHRRDSRPKRNHAVMVDGFAPANFQNTIQIKDRLFYLSNLVNGEQENFFGRVISSTPVTQTLTVLNPDLTAGPATLEFALQGVMNQIGSSHQVSVAINGVTLGSVLFGALEHPVRSFSVPMSQLQPGSNNVTFTKTSTGEVCLIDYIRLTYPHAFAADSGSLKFALRGSQTLNVEGFSTPSVRLIDYTDPLNVILIKPASEPSASGYAITVPEAPSSSKAQRSLLAIPRGQFEQPAGLSLNQPSTLNVNSNAAGFLIIAHKTFIPGLGPLVNKRQLEGLTPAVVDIEDVYDEFGYGTHGPQAVKEFLRHAATHWSTAPRYVIFAGDASLDPRDYFNVGNFDFVPTKLLDATFNETASDDWLADFDNDGIADIPVGRLPLRSLADANLVISKIVNFTPVTPQAALLIADDPGTPAVWDFETSTDAVQALLPPTMLVQRVNVRTDLATATADIITGFNQGRAVVNYSGHGNVDVWSGASIFTSANATALANGNKLPFVIVTDCLNGYYHDPTFLSLAEAFLKAPGGGAVAVFASSGLTTTFGQRQMELELYRQLYGSQPLPVGDAIRIAKAASTDFDVRTTWIFFGDPSIKIR